MRGVLAAIACLLAMISAQARDLGQWDAVDPQVKLWYQHLVQPDNGLSCCGESDAYWADEYHVDAKGNLIATITDDRDDKPLGRYHVPLGTKYIVPQNKVVDATRQRGNPSGHTIIFLGTLFNNDPTTRPVLCWVGGGGS